MLAPRLLALAATLAAAALDFTVPSSAAARPHTRFAAQRRPRLLRPRPLSSRCASSAQNQQDSPLVPVSEAMAVNGYARSSRAGGGGGGGALRRKKAAAAPATSKAMAAEKAREMGKIARNPALLNDVIFSDAYDPEELTNALKDRQLAVVSRSAQVVGTLGMFISKALLLYSAGNFEASKRELAIELKAALIKLGPSFVKFGQALSTRPDVTPPEFIEVLSSLQDRLPSFPTETAMSLIEQELGRPVDSVFSEISPEPIAAASLGQVYRGRLKSGQDVAIKVQRPDISEGIAIDMLLLRRLILWVDENVNIGPLATSKLLPLVDEFTSRLFGELDYIREGKSANKFKELYEGKKGMQNVTAPAIYWNATSRRVLTMEWIDGVKLTDRDAIEAMGLRVIDFVDMGVQCTLRQLLEQGFFHADPHPGNLMVTRDGKLCYLDFGMMSTIPPKARYALISHVVHLVNRDYEAMCNDYYDLDFVSRDVDTRPIAPALAAFFDDALAYSVSELNFGALIDGLGEVFFQYPFQLPPYYALILRSLTFLEGLALRADPSYKLLAASYPYMAQRLLTDPSPELRSSLEELVLRQGRVRWSRFEGLLNEGVKSSGFDDAGMWLLLDWLCGDQGRNVREPAARELVSLADGAVLSAIRRAAPPLLRDRLAPLETRADLEILERADRLATLLAGRIPAPTLARAALASRGDPQSLLRAMREAADGIDPAAAPQDAVRAARAALALARDSSVRMRGLMQSEGGRELASTIAGGLVQRGAARAARAILALGEDTPRKPGDEEAGGLEGLAASISALGKGIGLRSDEGGEKQRT
mmetsp:Transcript_24441/g.47860  ORF Transcript_24441/g.47860 Transcript_24441/m.47860 type:complete len:820 (+) Transcript_24441:50-2509(+)